MKRLSAIAALLLSLAACTAPPPPSQPGIDLSGVQPIQLNVAQIEVVDRYAPPGIRPHVEHTFRTPPAAARQLVERALVAAGPAGLLRVYIDDARVVEVMLPVQKGWKGAFSDAPAARYEARVALRFELSDLSAPDIIKGNANVVSTRNSTVLNSQTLAERDTVAYGLNQDILKDIAGGLDTVVRNTFGMNR